MAISSWCEQKYVHTGFVKMALSDQVSLDCFSCSGEIEGPYYFDVDRAEIICASCFDARNKILEEEKKEKEARKTRPRVKGEPTKKAIRARKKVDDDI